MNTERRPTPQRFVGPREGEDWSGPGRNAGNPPLGYVVDASGDEPYLLTCQAEARAMHAAWVLRTQHGPARLARVLNRNHYRCRATKLGSRFTPVKAVQYADAWSDEWEMQEVGR